MPPSLDRAPLARSEAASGTGHGHSNLQGWPAALSMSMGAISHRRHSFSVRGGIHGVMGRGKFLPVAYLATRRFLLFSFYPYFLSTFVSSLSF
jgi:hypothetical protein